MKVGSKETLECRAYSSRGVIRTTTYGHTSLMYGIGWFEFIARSTPPRRCGEEKATHIPTFRCFRCQTFNHDVPLRGAQSPFFNFQLEKPDRNSSPLLPILPFSKAETRCVHCMGAPTGVEANRLSKSVIGSPVRGASMGRSRPRVRSPYSCDWKQVHRRLDDVRVTRLRVTAAQTRSGVALAPEQLSGPTAASGTRC